MRKALIPLLASLAVCGAATTAMVMSSARAQTGPHKPLMVAGAATPGLQLAANDTPPSRDMGLPGVDREARLRQMCDDLYARQTAQLAYLETSLQLTASERPLFERWKDAKLTIAHRHADACAQRPLPQRDAARGPRPEAQGLEGQNQERRERPSPADRMTREENFLKQRLADLETGRPALEAFYNALSPVQKMEVVRAGMRGPEGGMRRRHMFADARGPLGGMGPARMGEGQMSEGQMREGPMGPPPGPPDAPPPER